ncbi:ParB N-terminal domain-containing protein [Streptomyces sp. SID8381]|uniref:ParB N-terminal domain-containing protein n=1 Tax=unclassified Streptomyces TaxID=2593676 RepID=UPI00036D5444|nr:MULTISPECIES: ParB N-terminal domain-containing protein [unclassified Streptomyces]MYX26729.1 ParB N-terminal domain-containing protein [Streptomyces sp. SID8381]
MSTIAAPRYTSYVPLTDLTPSPGNPKRHEIERIIESIETHGFLDQGIVDERTGLIIGGHGRREALIEMQARGARLPDGLLVDEDGGWLVPVQRGWSSRNDLEAKAVIIKLNRLTEAAGWDSRSLAEYLEELATGDAALFDSLNYSDDEMEQLLRQVDPESLPGGSPDAECLADFGGADGGFADSGDNDRASTVCCPACGELFTPGQ